MALRGTLTHRKTRRLGKALAVSPCFALGICEALWHVAGEQAPAGDVGRMSNEDLAMEMFYDDDPAALVAALLEAGLVDADPTHRLIIHDWHLHSDDTTDNKLARATKHYANGALPRMTRLSRKDRAVACARYATPTHEKPLPEPEPEPEPVKEVQKPSRGKREVDPRHVPFKLATEVYAKHKSVLFVWDASEAKQLDLLLKATPDLTLQQFQTCLNHRARSPGTPHGERPRLWLPNILRYTQGPLNEFGKTGEVDGNHQAKSESSLNAAQRVIQAIEDRRSTGEAERAPAG